MGEEVMTDIANTVYDTVANGDLSQYALEIQQYMDLGYSEKQAKHLWSVDFGEQLAMTAFSSFIMGGLLSGGNYVKAAKYAPYINKTADMLQQAYNMPREDALKIMTNHVLSGESQAETQSLIERANDIVNNLNMLNSQDANTANLFEGLSEQESAGLNQSNLNSQENVANIPNNEYNDSRGNGYGRTDEFRRIQEESRRESFESVQKQDTYTKSNEGLRRRLSRVFTEEVERSRSNTGNTQLLHLETDKGTSFDIVEGIDAQTFHDIFEVVRKYTANGELVDIHDVKTTDNGIGYEDCKNYISNDGMSGFSITPSGDLISVFNASDKKGFLRSISEIVKQNTKTLDCYASPNQDLQKIYSDIFGFKTASVMDYNMEYDHDNIAQNHNSPQVAFMVNTDSDVETKYFDKDSYDEAQAYQRSFFNAENGNVTGNETLQEQGSVNTQENVVAEQQSVEDESTNNTVNEATSQVKNSYENPVITENFTDDDATHTEVAKRIDYSNNIDFNGTTLEIIKQEYTNAEDKELSSYAKRVLNGEKTKPYYTIGKVTQQLTNDVKNLLGIDISEFDNALNRSAINHIEKRHGINGLADQSMKNVSDIARINYILNNYDTIDLLENSAVGYSDSNNNPAKNIRMSKRINGVYYLAEAVADGKNGKLWIQTAYKTTEAPIKSFGDTSIPQVTPEAYHENNASNSNISNSQPDVKQNNANGDKKKPIQIIKPCHWHG